MITKPANMIFISRIAGLFCTASPFPLVCQQGSKRRMNDNFTDQIFEGHVLPFLDVSMFKSVTQTSVRPDRNGKKFFKFRGFDIISNESFEVEIGGVPTGLPYPAIFQHLNSWFSQKGANIQCEVVGILNNRIIVKWTSSKTYGISFIPGSVGGEGGITITPPDPIEPVVNLPGQPVAPEAGMFSGFNLDDYLLPGLAVGAALLIYYSIK